MVSFCSSTAGAFFPWSLAVTVRHNSCCRGGSVRHCAVRRRPRCLTPVAPLLPMLAICCCARYISACLIDYIDPTGHVRSGIGVR